MIVRIYCDRLWLLREAEQTPAVGGERRRHPHPDRQRVRPRWRDVRGDPVLAARVRDANARDRAEEDVRDHVADNGAVRVGAVARDGELDGLGPDEEQDALAAGHALRGIDAELPPAMLHDAVVAYRRYEPVHGSDELGDERRGRTPVHLGRSAHLLDAAAVHDRDPVGDGEGLLLVVRDVERRDPELELDAPDLLAELDAHLRVKGRERLVEQEDARLDGQRACERDALLHSAGELMRIALARIPESDELEEFAHPLASFCFRLLADAERSSRP